jgi:hypothetical protein
MLDVETRRLLAECAYLACVTNQPAQARRILGGLAGLTPGAREVVVGDAMVALTEGDAEGAVARLRPLADSGDQDGIAFLALALKMAGRGAECDATLHRLPAGDAAADALAASLRGG